MLAQLEKAALRIRQQCASGTCFGGTCFVSAAMVELQLTKHRSSTIPRWRSRWAVWQRVAVHGCAWKIKPLTTDSERSYKILKEIKKIIAYRIASYILRCLLFPEQRLR